MIKAVVFDCFGVLYRGSLGHLFDFTPLEKQAELTDISHASDRGFLSKQEYLEQVAVLTSKTPDEIVTILSNDHIRNEQMFMFIKELRSQVEKTALLSNVGQHIIDGLIPQRGLDELFDVVVLSSNIHMVKPYPEIFEHTIDQLQLQPHECVMIDDLQENIEGAKAVGLEAILYESFPQVVSDLRKLLENNA